MSPRPARSAIKLDLFADQGRSRKIEQIGDPLQLIARNIDFADLAGFIDGLFLRAASGMKRRISS